MPDRTEIETPTRLTLDPDLAERYERILQLL